MPAEKQNNLLPQKIDAMNELPAGIEFHPGKTWSRLEPRLKKQIINFRAVIFAAASFIALIIFISLPSKRNDYKDKLISKPATAELIKELPVKGIHPGLTTQIPVQAKARDSRRVNSISHPVESKFLVKKVTLLPQNDVVKAEEELSSEIKTEPVVTVSVKQKRKFPIAHINELNNTHALESEQPVSYLKTTFALRKKSYENPVPPLINFEEGFTDRKKQKTIFPLLNSSQ